MSGTSGHSLNSLVQGTIVEGDVHSSSDIRIDGTIKGSLKCDAKVIIGPTGAVEGEISCQYAVIEGRFEGSLFVANLLDIKEKANINGEIRYGKIVVQPGAVLIGDVRMVDKAASNGQLKKSFANGKSKGSTSTGPAKLEKESAN